MKKWNCRQAPFKSERTQRGKFCSDSSQGSEESLSQEVSQVQKMSHK